MQNFGRNNRIRCGMVGLFALIMGTFIIGCGGSGLQNFSVGGNAHPAMAAAAATVGPIKSNDSQVTSGYGSWINSPKATIDAQVTSELSFGANTVAIATPYDYPNQYGLWTDSIFGHGGHTYHRSHFNHWEGVNGAPGDMIPSDYVSQYKQFVLGHPGFYHAGDYVDPCVEAENGKYWTNKYGSNWTSNPTAIAEFNEFRRNLKDAADAAFAQIGLGGKILTNLASMNGWIADKNNHVLEQATIDKLGMLTLDHYPQQTINGTLVPADQMASAMSADLDKFHSQWNVPIMIGEWGYNIDQDVTDDQQKQAVDAMMKVFASKPYVIGVNYWCVMGNNTRLINDSGGLPTGLRPAATVLQNFFNSFTHSATITSSSGGATTPPPTPTPTVTGKVLADFGSGLSGFDGGTVVSGALQLSNAAKASTGAKKFIGGIVLGQYANLEFDINVLGNSLRTGNATEVYIDQGGNKEVFLVDKGLVKSGVNGWQHVNIPLSSIAGLNLNSDAAYLGFRFWNDHSASYQIDNVQLTSGSSTVTPAPTISKVLENFDNGMDGWNGGKIVAGFNSTGALEITNPANNSSGSNKSLNGLIIGDYSTIEMDINTKGTKLLSGDASALYFDQGGWKSVSLSNPKYVNSSVNGWQHVSIPLSDFIGLNKNAGLASIGFRFWNNPAGSYDIDNIVLSKK